MKNHYTKKNVLVLALAALPLACGSADESGAGVFDDVAPSEENVAEESQALSATVILRAGNPGSIVTDSYIDSGESTRNFGGNAIMFVGAVSGGRKLTGLIKWDLSLIPVGSTVTSASLTIASDTAWGPAPEVHRATFPWSSSTVNWVNFAGGYDAGVVAKFNGLYALGSQRYWSVGVTSLVQDWVSQKYANHGVALVPSPADTNYAALDSSEAGVAANRPTLTISYTTPFCYGAANGTVCNDNNACTQASTCQNGLCVGTNPVVCPSMVACQVGVCNPMTGACSATIAPNGAACNDNNACTQTSSCQSGMCIGANPVSCTAVDSCRLPGVCQAATGICAPGPLINVDTTSGLAHRWTFNEPSGGPLDSVGTAHGTFSNGATRTPSFDGSMALTGTPDQAGSGSGSVIFPVALNTAGYTVSQWMWIPNGTSVGGYFMIAGSGWPSWNAVSLAGWFEGAGRVTFNAQTSTNNNFGLFHSATLEDGAWHNQIVVRGPSSMQRYVDGVLVDSRALTARLTVAAQLQFNVWPTRQIKLDDIRVYQRALGLCEAKALAQPTLPTGNPAGIPGNLSGTVDDSMLVHLNGAPVLDVPSAAGGGVKSAIVNVADGDQIAVQATDVGGAFGFTMLLTWGTNKLTSNTSDWKCTTAVPLADWKSKTFNDSAWPVAVAGNQLQWGIALQSEGARPIWASGGAGKTVYCRAKAKKSTSPIVRLASNYEHTCAVLDTGKVRCWGGGASGRLGYGNVNNIGDDEDPATAGDVTVGGTVVEIAVGALHTCALLDTGKVRCWGLNTYGELGYAHTNDIGDNESPATAGDVNLGGTAKGIAVGARHTCALLDTGAVRCWGHSNYGQLGYGNTNTIGDNETPASAGDVPLGGIPTAQIAANGDSTCALGIDGTVRCWGLADTGQLGYGNVTNIGDNETPASIGAIPFGVSFRRVELGARHTCAITVAGDLRCWGRGFDGRLGNGGVAHIGDDEPVAPVGPVALGAPVASVGLGHEHTCARLENGELRCWGLGVNGALGYGNGMSIGDDELPLPIAVPTPAANKVSLFAAGWHHNCAVLPTGKVQCWGVNGAGRLGYGTAANVGATDTLADTGYACIIGTCNGSVRKPAAACKTIRAADMTAPDGVYTLTAAGSTIHTYCDMTDDGGGWSLVMRARRSNATGWGTSADLNLGDLRKYNVPTSSKVADTTINALRTVGFRAETFNCTGAPPVATVAFFKPDCLYNHNAQATANCATGYGEVAFATPTIALQEPSLLGLSNYTMATYATTSIITHDPASGLGNDSWWAGGANRCDLDVYVK